MGSCADPSATAEARCFDDEARRCMAFGAAASLVCNFVFRTDFRLVATSPAGRLAFVVTVRCGRLGSCRFKAKRDHHISDS